MKLKSTVLFTLLLLGGMLVSGFVSAALGLNLGRDALKGITQPDTRPTNNLVNRRKNASNQKNLVILQEAEILKQVKARTEAGSSTPGKK